MAGRYEMKSEMRQGVEVFQLIEHGKAKAEIVPSLGNNCYRFDAADAVLEEVSFDEFRNKPGSYGIPILFPFPNRIRDGMFTYGNQSYRVDPPRHGFVRNKNWKVVEQGSDAESAWIHSRVDASDYSAEILQQFPFPFILEVIYRLKDGRLEMQTIVKNSGKQDLPFGYGIHPYFRLPEKGTLQVPAAKYWELVDSLPTGKTDAVKDQYDLRKPKELSTMSLDDIFSDLEGPESVRCVLHDAVKQLDVTVEFSKKQFPYAVIFNAPAPRKAICIEPYTCPTDVFNLHNKGIDSNLLILRPGEEMELMVKFSCVRSSKSL